VQQGETDPAEVLERYQSAIDLVDLIARRLARTFGSTVDSEELLGAGREGLYDAARKYDPTRDNTFRTFANYRVRGAVIDAVRRSAHLPRGLYNELRALEAAALVTDGEAGVALARATQAISPGAAETRLTRHLGSVATAAAIEMAGPASSNAIVDPAMNPEEQLADAELLDLIRRCIDDMEPNEACIIRAFYFEGKSLSEIGESNNFTRSWACRLHARAMARLSKRIKSGV